MKRKIAIITHNLAGGGLATMTWYLYQALAASGEYQPAIFLLATSSLDPLSLRLTDPTSWFKGVRTQVIDWRGLPVHHIGVLGVELESQRYRRRSKLDQLLQGVRFVSVCGGQRALGLRDNPLATAQGSMDSDHHTSRPRCADG